MVEQNGGTNAPVNSGTGGGGRGMEDTEDVSGNTCRERLQLVAVVEVEHLEVGQISESFGE